MEAGEAAGCIVAVDGREQATRATQRGRRAQSVPRFADGSFRSRSWRCTVRDWSDRPAV
jgi:hypothetical protein